MKEQQKSELQKLRSEVTYSAKNSKRTIILRNELTRRSTRPNK